MAKKTKKAKKQFKKTTKKITKKLTKTPSKKMAQKSTAKASSPKGVEAVLGPSLGSLIPDFALPATGGQPLRLSDFRGLWVVLYFYPKDATPGCTLEGQDFTRLHSQFKRLNAEVLGVSRDSLRSHEKFKEKQNYSIELLADEDERLCEIFSVIKMKNMYGRKVRGIERSTFLIDPKGRLAYEWRGVKVPGHAEEVLAHLKSLSKA